MNRKLLLLVILITLFLITEYLIQNQIPQYSGYKYQKWQNKDLLSIKHNDSSDYKLNSNNSKPLNPKINQTINPNKVIKVGTDIKRTDTCKPKYNIVFLKTHKCASTTIQNIFARNGYLNKKVFVLPAQYNYLGHPTSFNRKMVPDPKQFNHEYNILTHHSRLDYNSMHSLMPNDTLFITIVRNPVHLYESMFHYYQLDKFLNISFDVFGDPNAIISAKALTNRANGRIGINQMVFDLGMSESKLYKPNELKKYITYLDSIFDLIMVSERMYESLVLLKNLLCWTTDQLVVFKLNARHIIAKNNLSEMASTRIRDMNWADTQLYKHFSNKFSLLVKAFGFENMKREVNELKHRTYQWFDYCVGNNTHTKSADPSGHPTRSDYPTIYVKNRYPNNTNCWLLTADELNLAEFIRKRQKQLYPGSVFNATSK